MSKFSLRRLSNQLTIAMVAVPILFFVVFVVYLTSFSQGTLSWKMLVAIGIIIFVYALFSYFFIKRISVRIHGVKEMIYNLSQGEFNHIFTIKGEDDISAVGKMVIDIKRDLNRKTEFANLIKDGDIQSDFVIKHENDVLGQSLISIKENLIKIKEEEKKQNWGSETLGKFVEILRSSNDVKELTNNIIRNLVNSIHANQGAIYIVEQNEEGEEHLVMKACYAFQRTKYLDHSVAIGEGLIGQAYLEKETIYLKDAPENFIKITSGLGEANPRFILIVPLKINENIIGMAELASFREFSEHEIAFVEKIGENIAHTISSIQISQHTKKLLDDSQELTEQMRAQEEELKQNQEELQATQEEISRKYKQLFKELKALNYESRFDQLKSITLTKKRSIEYYFDIIRNQIITFSENKMVINAMSEFKEAFFKLTDGSSPERSSFMKDSLKKYYAEEFIPRLNENSTDVEGGEKYLPAELVTSLLQFHYISNNQHPTGQKSALDDAGDGSDYSRVHAAYHAVMRSFLEKFGYYDIFLIDHETGYMVYSVFKEVDFGTSLLHGVFSKTNFGRIVKEAAESSQEEFVKLIDFEPYDPSYWAPASFIARPIYDNGKKIGILVFQMPINKINQVLTGKDNWKEDGLGDSGETFIIGDDYKMRSIARELVEDPDAYFKYLRENGYGDDTIRQIRKTGTNILLEKVESDSVRAGLAGETGTQLEKDKFGIERLFAFAPLDIPDVHWAILSCMREKEVSLRINDLQQSELEN